MSNFEDRKRAFIAAVLALCATFGISILSPIDLGDAQSTPVPTPTEYVFATPTVEVWTIASRCWQSATVTASPALVVRNKPGGQLLRSYPLGREVEYDPDTMTVSVVSGRSYNFVELKSGGWAALDFMKKSGSPNCIEPFRR